MAGWTWFQTQAISRRCRTDDGWIQDSDDIDRRETAVGSLFTLSSPFYVIIGTPGGPCDPGSPSTEEVWARHGPPGSHGPDNKIEGQTSRKDYRSADSWEVSDPIISAAGEEPASMANGSVSPLSDDPGQTDDQGRDQGGHIKTDRAGWGSHGGSPSMHSSSDEPCSVVPPCTVLHG